MRRPFTPEATKFKVQSVFRGATGCLIAPYIDARLVVERLNRVCPDLWWAHYTPLEGTKLAWCHLTVDGVTRSDVGESPKGMSKDLVSDALKRAAVHFGIGVVNYALPQIIWYTNKAGPNLEKKQGPKGETLMLTEAGHRSLRESYASWLEAHGVRKFGEPLDHGDVEGAVFDEDDAAEEEFVPEAPPALEDKEAERLVADIHGVYDSIRGLGETGTRAVPPARFKEWLARSQHSHGALQELLSYLQDRLEKLGGGS